MGFTSEEEAMNCAKAIAPFVKKRDERIAELEAELSTAQHWKDAGEWLFSHTGSILAGSTAGHHEAIVYIGSMRKRVSSVRDTPLEAIEALRREVDDE